MKDFIEELTKVVIKLEKATRLVEEATDSKLLSFEEFIDLNDALRKINSAAQSAAADINDLTENNEEPEDDTL